jgi:Kef-type K+ transport system membrane component KefB
MKEQVIAALCHIDMIRIRRTVTVVRLAGGVAVLALAVNPAMAQSLKQAGVNIFNVIYGVVGVIGAIACLLTLLNWVTGNWLGRDDPKKIFFQSLLGTALAFGVVAIIQFVKDMVGGSASGISNL